MTKPVIAFLLGSKNDLPQLEGAETFLKQMEITYEVRIMSAHRTPERVREYGMTARERGLKIMVGMAGMAAHLAGVLAATTDLPVLGIPAAGGVADGLDALLSTVQMPGGVPVATFAVGKAGGMNAAVFACQVLGLSDPTIAKKLEGFRAAQRAKVEKDDDEVRKARA